MRCMYGHHPSFGGWDAADSCRSTTVTRPGARLGFWSSSSVPSGLRVPSITTSLGLMVLILYLSYIKELVEEWGYTEADAKARDSATMAWMAVPLINQLTDKVE